MLRILTALAAIGAVSTPALADDHADYGINVGYSPFGYSGALIYNHTASTSINVAFGGLPAAESFIKVSVDGDDYTNDGGASWMGVFVNHRPFEESQWFRVSTGIGIGGIQGELENDSNGDKYDYEFNENPVGYIGIGFGNGTAEGFTFGFDMGALFGSGPEVTPVGDADAEAVDDIKGSLGFGNILPNAQVTVGYNF